MKLLRILGWLLLVALLIANWPLALMLGGLYGLLSYHRKPQPTRRRVTTGRVAR